jgi:hypothetical protein
LNVTRLFTVIFAMLSSGYAKGESGRQPGQRDRRIESEGHSADEQRGEVGENGLCIVRPGGLLSLPFLAEAFYLHRRRQKFQ